MLIKLFNITFCLETLFIQVREERNNRENVRINSLDSKSIDTFSNRDCVLYMTSSFLARLENSRKVQANVNSISKHFSSP